MPSIEVTQFTRKPVAGAFSMEAVDDTVRKYMPSDVIVRVWQCKHHSRGLVARVADLISAALIRSQVNHVTGDVHYLTYLMPKRKTVLTIHDCVGVDRARGVRRFLVWLLWYWLPVKRCGKIVVISEATRTKLLSKVKCDPRKIEVIHNPVSDRFQYNFKPTFPEVPTLLIVGTTQHKNIERMVEAAKDLAVKWLVIGRLSRTQREALERSGREYENLFDLSTEQLVEQYKRCDALIFASTYEGFGLPIVEAQAVGRPVVTSNILSMPEVAGGAACLVDPFDVSSIRRGLQRILHDASYRDTLIALGLQNVTRFRPATVAARYADLYRRVAGCHSAYNMVQSEHVASPGPPN